MQTSLERHHAILRQAIEAYDGHIFQIIGDAFCASFARAPEALGGALKGQRSLHAEPWEETGPLNVRMGLHSGAAETREGDYLSSLTLVRVQRIMSAGHGGQILLSPTTTDLVRRQLPGGTSLRDLGKQRLRGLIQLENIFQLIVPDLPAQFPPLRVVESDEIKSESSAVLDRLIQDRLVARRSELQKLQEHWSQARQAHGHLVMLSGEPGIGKTRLSLELIAHAHKDGAAILSGGCYEYEAATPYLPFVEAIRDWVNRQSVEKLPVRYELTLPAGIHQGPHRMCLRQCGRSTWSALPQSGCQRARRKIANRRPGRCHCVSGTVLSLSRPSYEGHRISGTSPKPGRTHWQSPDTANHLRTSFRCLPASGSAKPE